MSKAALTFAEVFIVLALVFIIQTVANFGLYEGDVEGGAVAADREAVTIRQVPSGGDHTDHLMYLHFSADGVGEARVVVGAGTEGRTTVHCGDIRSGVDRSGACIARVRCSPGVYSLEEAAPWLEREYRVSLRAPPVEDAQPQYILTWVPGEPPADVEIRVGLELCELGVTDDTRSVAPSWGLTEDGEPLRFPHPLVITRTEYRRDNIVKHPRRVVYGHVAVLANLAEWIGEGQEAWVAWVVSEGARVVLANVESGGEEMAGAVFVGAGCEFGGNNVRRYGFWRV